MALQLKDRVRTACTTIGKAEIEIGSNRAGYQNWDGITDGNTVYYCVVEGNKWEVGYGVKTGTEITRNLLSSSTGSLLSLDGTADVFETYPAEKAVILNTDGNIELPSSNIKANKFVGDGSELTNIPTIDDTYTKTQTDTLLDSKANVGDSYTKAETYNNTEIDSKLFEKADKTTTYTKAEIDSQQLEQDAEITANTTDIETNTGNIASNTTAIGTLSGQVSQNSEDIAELQDSIFFTSAYSADYPSSPNRDPEDGNMYLQNFAMFTYSYAEATQIFCSKTDESGNVRQFTAVQAGDSIVLNEVDSPNYGRYELVSIEDVSDSYVVMNVIPKKGQGTVITGVKVAFQAFPKPGSGTGDGIPEAPIDGKQYGRQDATWTEVTGGGDVTPSKTHYGALTEPKVLPSTSETDFKVVPFAGDRWVDGKFIADTKGSYDLNVGLSWSLINPIADQTFRRCVLFVNNAVISTKSHGIDEMYPHGSKNESNWVIDLEAGDEVEVKALQQNSQGSDQNVANTQDSYVRIAMLGGSGSGGGEAQAPVAFNLQLTSSTTTKQGVNTPIVLDKAVVDTENGLKDGGYEVQKDGLYDISFIAKAQSSDGNLNNFYGYVYLNGTFFMQGSADPYKGGASPTGGKGFTVSGSSVLDLKKGDVITLELYANTADSADTTVPSNALSLSGHMISSFTEGSGGGTPEDMVWENVTADRVTDNTYTNDNDVPLYVQIDTLEGANGANFAFEIDGNRMGKIGTKDSQSSFFIVPSKATYRLIKMVAEGVIENWNEAKMPLAIGVPSVDTSIGMVAPFAMDSVPTGWLHCDGSAVSRTTYSLLYSKVGDTYGNGDGSTTFNLPNLQDDFIRGSSDTLAVGNRQSDAFKSHNHAQQMMQTGGGNTAVLQTINLNPATEDTGNQTASTGGDETRPRNVAMLYCINATAEPSSGGSYTPEKMVWKQTNDPIRTFDTVYTNDDDSPRFVNINISYYYPGASSCDFYIDGELIAGMGRTEIPDAQHSYTTQMFVIPSGSTYELKQVAQSSISQWWEAKMPVAVGTGGKTVAFKGGISDKQTGFISSTFAKVNLDTTSIDTDNALTDGKFKPSVAGYYQVNGSVQAWQTPETTNVITKITKNGLDYGQGTQVSANNTFSSQVGDVVYLNGTTDYLELMAYITVATGTGTVDNRITHTYLSAVLVSGGSASGDSIWTESGNDVFFTNNNNGLYINTAEPNSVNLIGYDGTTFSDIWLRGGGTPNTGVGVMADGNINIRGTTTLNDNLTINTGELLVPDMSTTVQPSNVYIDGKGQFYKSTTAFYSADDVDKKLAIKDKLIEKLSARLDELEKKVK